jgi:hypothetical protein
MAPERCPYCGRWYAVHPRLWGRQKTCGDAKCRAKHKAELNRKWRKDHPEEQREREKSVMERRGRERYWDERRSRDPDYVKRNRERTRERMRRLRAERKESGVILKDPVGYLEGLKAGCVEMFATQEPIRGFSVGMWNYLRVRAMFATREGIAAGAGEGVQREP